MIKEIKPYFRDTIPTQTRSDGKDYWYSQPTTSDNRRYPYD